MGASMDKITENAGWERINNERLAAFYILGKKDYNGWLEPDDALLSKFISINAEMKVLDMGCGLGRNCIWLYNTRQDCMACGYDLSNMIQLAKEYTSRHLGTENGIAYESNWDKLKQHNFDCIFSMLTLQHVLPKYLDDYYTYMAKTLSKSSFGRLFVHGRDWSDHNDREIVWERLLKYFDVDQNHCLSKNFLNSHHLWTKEFKPGDHHMAVFVPKNI